MEVVDRSATLSEIPPPASTPASGDKPKSKRGGYRPSNPGGRPRKIPLPIDAPQGEEVKARKAGLVLPLLPHGNKAKIEEVAKWVHSLTEDQHKHIVCYFYRTYPIWNAKKFDPKSQTNIEIIAGDWPLYSGDRFELDFMAKHGSGDYYVAINEDSTHRWTVYFKTTRDYDNYPPVMDYRLLDVVDPANKPFVTWARGKGRLNDIDLPEQENDMAANAAIDRLVDQNDRLVTRVVDMSERAGTSPDVDTSAQLAGMEMIQRAGERALDVAMKSADRMAELQGKSNDPLELVKAFTDMSQSLNRRDTGGDDKITNLMQQMINQAEKRADRLEDELKEIRAERRNNSGNGDGEGSGGMLGALKGLSEIKNTLTELGIIKGSDEGSTAEHESKGKSSSLKDALLQTALQQLPAMLPQILGAGGINGLLVNGFRLIQAARGQGPAPTVADSAPAAVAAAPPPGPVVPPAIISNGFPFPSLSGNQVIDELIVTVWRFTPTFLHQMHNSELNGYTFARWLIDSAPNGRQKYDEMKEAGLDDVTTMLKMYPPLWQALEKTPEKTKTFLTEVLRLDEWEKEQAELDNDVDEDEGDAANASA